MPVFAKLVAVNPNSPKVAKIVLSPGQNVSSQENKLMSFVCEWNREEILNCMTNGADVNAKNGKQETALMVAIQKGDEEVCKLLLEHGCDADMLASIRPFYSKLTPLCCAVRENNFSIVRLLLNHKCDVNQCDEFGRPATFYAVSNGNEEMLRLLILSGCDVNSGTKDSNFTLLHEACAKSKVNHVQALLELGADPNVYEMTSRTTPAFHSPLVSIQQLLVKYGLNINLANRNGGTPLHVAVRQGNLPLVVFFLQNGALMNLKQTKYFYSVGNMLNKMMLQDPFDIAIEEQHVNICMVLLQHGFNPFDCIHTGDQTKSNHADVSLVDISVCRAKWQLIMMMNSIELVVRILLDCCSHKLMNILGKLVEHSALTDSGKSILQFTNENCTQPFSLKLLACSTVRNQIKYIVFPFSIYNSIMSLDLPCPLKEFLLLNFS